MRVPAPTAPVASRGRRARLWRAATVTLGALGLALSAPASTAQVVNTGTRSVHDPVDPADWVKPEDTTWDDYRPIPDTPPGWVDGPVKGTVGEVKAAVVLDRKSDVQ